MTCCCLALGLAAATAGARTNQGTDYDELPEIADPLNWTEAIIDKGELVNDTVTFYLNPCEWVVYRAQNGSPRSCLPRPACTHLDAVEDMLILAMDVWEDLAGDALTLAYGGVLGGGQCPDTVLECEAIGVDHWTEDETWVVTRTYLPEFALTPQDCPDVDSPPTEGGAGLSLFFDDPNDDTTRRIVEGDVILGARKWDNTRPDCPGDETDRRTDDWSVENSGDDYSREIRSRFDTGFDWKLEAAVFDGDEGDYNAGTICVEFD